MAVESVWDIINKTLAEEDEPNLDIEVEKQIEPEYDLRNLASFDINILDNKQIKSNADDYLRSVARDGVQLLINRIWELPREMKDNTVVIKLSSAANSTADTSQYSSLPREKPVPKPRQMTKWEKYALEKGITKKKKNKVEWDEQLQKWIPRFGFRSVEADNEKDWLIEVGDHQDPNEDPFLKKKDAKRERVAKNELQRLRNIARARKIKIPGVGITPIEKPPTEQLTRAVSVAHDSTASMGKFQRKLPKEHNLAKSGVIQEGKKRKFQPVIGNSNDEKKRNLSILDGILNNKPKLNLTKAVNRQIHEDQARFSRENGYTKKTGKHAGKGGSAKKGGVKRGRSKGKVKVAGKAYRTGSNNKKVKK